MGEYSDDDLDDLPESVFQELENYAIALTQRQQQDQQQQQWQQQGRHVPPKQPPRQPALPHAGRTLDGHALGDDVFELDDVEILNGSAAANIPRPPVVRPAAAAQVRRTNTYASRPSSQHSQQQWNRDPGQDALQGNMARPGLPSVMASQRFQPPVMAPNRAAPSQFPRGFAPPPPRYAPSQSQAGALHPNAISALELRVRTLERELNVAKGEAAILRSNSTKAQQAHDAEIARLKKQTAEKMASQERAVQQALDAKRQAATELQFLQRDMQEVTNRARRKEPGAATTPKKSTRNWGVADGFDGMDLVPSPSKSNTRTKAGAAMAALSERTPTKGKRKRPAADSPVPPLDTHTNDDIVMLDDVVEVGSAPVSSARPVLVTSILPSSTTSINALPFDFLPLILDHASAHDQPPTFDSLSKYFFPSDPNTSFLSIIFQSLPTKSDPSDPMKFPTDFSSLILDLWVRCVEEGFVAPIGELVSLLSFILQLHSVSLVPRLLDKLLSIAQATLFVLGDLRTQTSDATPDAEPAGSSADSTFTATISLLSLSALISATSIDGTDDDANLRITFWKGIALDTVTHILNPKQPLYDIVGMLDMLSTSVLPSSIGPIAVDKEPPAVAAAILDKLSKLLVHPPVHAKSPAQRHAITRLILRTLLSFTASDFGLQQLAVHDNVVLRLVAALSKSVDELYDQDLSQDVLSLSKLRIRDNTDKAPTVDDALAASDMDTDVPGLCKVISLGIMLLHILVTDPRTADVIGLEDKFELWRAGRHKYLIMLCRLNFAEDDLVLEAGVDTETAERAHELLEALVTPDKGKDIGEAFGSPEE